MYKTHNIRLNFIQKYESDRDQFKKYVTEAIESIRDITFNDNDAVCDFIITIMEDNIRHLGEWTLHEFKYILELGVDLSSCIDDILFISSFYQKSDIFYYLVANYGINMEDFVVRYTVAGIGNIEILKFFLEQGLPQKVLDDALLYHCSNIRRLKLLLDHGANISHLVNDITTHNINNYSWTYLTLEFILETMTTKPYDYNYDPKCLTLFLKKIIIEQINSPNMFNYVKILVDLGANPREESIIMDACIYSNNAEIIRYLVNECNCDIKSVSLNKAINTVGNNIDVVKLLLEMGIEIDNEAIYEAIHCGNEYIDLLIDHGVSTERIAAIAVYDQIAIFKHLVQKGADFNQIIANN